MVPITWYTIDQFGRQPLSSIGHDFKRGKSHSHPFGNRTRRHTQQPDQHHSIGNHLGSPKIAIPAPWGWKDACEMVPSMCYSGINSGGDQFGRRPHLFDRESFQEFEMGRLE